MTPPPVLRAVLPSHSEDVTDRLHIVDGLAYLEGDVPIRSVRRTFNTETLQCWAIDVAARYADFQVVQHPSVGELHESHDIRVCRCANDTGRDAVDPSRTAMPQEPLALCEVMMLPSRSVRQRRATRGMPAVTPTRLWFEYPAARRWSISVAGGSSKWELLAYKLPGS